MAQRHLYKQLTYSVFTFISNYVAEFDFKWKNRKMNDTERTYEALSMI